MARRGRLRTGRVITMAALVALLGVVVILLREQRPRLDVYAPVEVAQASAGTTYAVDDQVCVVSPLGGTVREVRGTGSADGLTTEVARRPDGPPVIAFPVEDGAAAPVEGAPVPSGEEGACLRLLLTGDAVGSYRAAPLEVVVGYGPGGVLRRTLEVAPPSTLEVVRTGPDPRLG